MIRIKIKDIELSLEEAREVYNELHRLFGKIAPGPWLYPQKLREPWEPFPIVTYTTCESDSV